MTRHGGGLELWRVGSGVDEGVPSKKPLLRPGSASGISWASLVEAWAAGSEGFSRARHCLVVGLSPLWRWGAARLRWGASWMSRALIWSLSEREWGMVWLSSDGAGRGESGCGVGGCALRSYCARRSIAMEKLREVRNCGTLRLLFAACVAYIGTCRRKKKDDTSRLS